jgi:hypothetical protein
MSTQTKTAGTKLTGLTAAVREAFVMNPTATTSQIAAAVNAAHPELGGIKFRPVFGALRRIAASAEKKAAKSIVNEPAAA